MILRALTLTRPWASSIAHGPKRVENRSWRPGADFPEGSVLAIHAGRRWDEDDLAWILERWPACPDREELHPAGAVVALAEVVKFERHQELFPVDEWSFGPWCWRLGRVFALAEPLPVRGAQGLWRLPTDLEADLVERWALTVDGG